MMIKKNGFKLTFSIVFSSIVLMGCEPKTQYLSPQVEAKGEKYKHCNNTVPFGFPIFLDKNKVDENNLLFSCHDNYTLVYNTDLRMAYWTAEHLLGSDLKKYKNSEERIDRVRQDINLPKNIGDLALYEYDKASNEGFKYRPFVPTKDWLGNKKAMSKTYYISNMFPYPKDIENIRIYKKYLEYLVKIEKENENRKLKNEELIEPTPYTPKTDKTTILWRNIEDYVRNMIIKYEEGYVFSGAIYYRTREYPLGMIKRFGEVIKGKSFTEMYNDRSKGKNKKNFFGDAQEKVGEVGVAVPTYLYKMIYFPKQKQTIVLIVPNFYSGLKNTNPNSYKQSLATLEKMTGLSFFPLK